VESSREFNTREFAAAIGHTETSLFGIYKKENLNTLLLKTILSKLNVSLSDFFFEEKGVTSEPGLTYGKPTVESLMKRQKELMNQLTSINAEIEQELIKKVKKKKL